MICKWVTTKVNPFYEVNEYGDVRNKETGRLLRHQIDKKGRHVVQLMGQTLTVSRLVAEAFIGDIPDDMDVIYLDGNKSNLHVGNLKICTRRETIRRGMERGTFVPNNFGKEKIPVRVIETGKEYGSINECARDLKCSTGDISNYLLGYRRPVKGFTFEKI